MTPPTVAVPAVCQPLSGDGVRLVREAVPIVVSTEPYITFCKRLEPRSWHCWRAGRRSGDDTSIARRLAGRQRPPTRRASRMRLPRRRSTDQARRDSRSRSTAGTAARGFGRATCRQRLESTTGTPGLRGRSDAWLAFAPHAVRTARCRLHRRPIRGREVATNLHRPAAKPAG